MERDNFSKRADQSAEQPKVVYIGGCKVTVRYSGQKNPSAVKRIKDTLIAGFLHFLLKYEIIMV